jgi:hypothetical protein
MEVPRFDSDLELRDVSPILASIDAGDLAADSKSCDADISTGCRIDAAPEV